MANHNSEGDLKNGGKQYLQQLWLKIIQNWQMTLNHNCEKSVKPKHCLKMKLILRQMIIKLLESKDKEKISKSI